MKEEQPINKYSMDYLGSNSEHLPKVDLPEVKGRVNTQPTEIAEPVNTDNFSNTIYKALNEGSTIVDVKNNLANKGIDEDEANLTITNEIKGKIKQAREVGYDEEEISNFLASKGYDPETLANAMQASKINESYKRLDFNINQVSEQDRAMGIADTYKSVYSKYSTFGKEITGALFNEEMAIEARREINQLNYGVVEELKKQGIEAFIHPEDGEVMMRDANGLVTEVDSSILNDLFNSKGEFAGAVGGAIAGARLGSMAGAAGGSVVPGIGTAAGGLGGAIAGAISGGAMGAAAGKALDLTINAKKLSEDLTAQLYMSQMKEAAAADAIFGVIGSVAWKLSAKGWRGIKKGFQHFTHGNSNGAFKVLKENLNIPDEEVADIIDSWERLNRRKAPGSSFEEKAIRVISETQKEVPAALKTAAGSNERITKVLKQEVDERAKGLQKAIANITDDNIGGAIRKDLTRYEKDVKDFYGAVKDMAVKEIQGTDFRFDYDKLAIEPVLKDIGLELSDPIKRQQFVNYSTKIANASEDRTFGGLLELRAIVNNFKYSKTSLKPRDINALNTVINKIDGQIGKAAKTYLPNGAEWSKQFAKAKEEYAKMKVIKENTLYKLITKDGATEKTIRANLSKYSTAKDVDGETFNLLVDKLSPKVRIKTEGAAVKNLIDKYTVGHITENQAVIFPKLAEELRGLNLKTPQAKRIIKLVDEFAKVYKNDPDLAGLTSRFNGSIESSIAQSLGGKLKQYLVKSMWGRMIKYTPTDLGKEISLIHNIDKLFKNPLHSATAEQVLKDIPDEAIPEVRSLMKELAIEQAKKGPIKEPTMTRMYKQSKSGKLVTTDGTLGKGVYLVDKIKNPLKTNTVASKEVDTSKLATLEDIATIVGRDVDIKEVRNLPNINNQLMEKGFNGIKFDNRAMLFPELLKTEAK